MVPPSFPEYSGLSYSYNGLTRWVLITLNAFFPLLFRCLPDSIGFNVFNCACIIGLKILFVNNKGRQNIERPLPEINTLFLAYHGFSLKILRHSFPGQFYQCLFLIELFLFLLLELCRLLSPLLKC